MKELAELNQKKKKKKEDTDGLTRRNSPKHNFEMKSLPETQRNC